MEQKRSIKNYIQVVVLFLVAIVVVIYLSSWYSNYKKDKLSVPVINGVLSEINYEELDPYLQENDGQMYLYMCTSDEDVCRNFEKDFIKVIKKKNLFDKITYLNLTKKENKKEFLKDFNNKYAKKTKVYSYPTIVRFKNGKIKEVIGGSNGLTINELKKYVEEKGIQ